MIRKQIERTIMGGILLVGVALPWTTGVVVIAHAVLKAVMGAVR